MEWYIYLLILLGILEFFRTRYLSNPLPWYMYVGIFGAIAVYYGTRKTEDSSPPPPPPPPPGPLNLDITGWDFSNMELGFQQIYTFTEPTTSIVLTVVNPDNTSVLTNLVSGYISFLGDSTGGYQNLTNTDTVAITNPTILLNSESRNFMGPYGTSNEYCQIWYAGTDLSELVAGNIITLTTANPIHKLFVNIQKF